MITLETAKRHLQVEGTNMDDEYITVLIESSTSIIERDILAEYCELNTREQHIFDQAVLLLVGDYYKNREDTTDLNIKTIPNGVSRLCNLIRRYNR